MFAGCFPGARRLAEVALCLFLVVNTFSGRVKCDDEYEKTCNKANGTDCGTCAKDRKCYWCTSSKTCHYYAWNSVKTYFKYCSWGDARWKHCWLNVEALVISLSVIGGIILILLCACCCWCRNKCRKRNQRRMEREENELDRQSEERTARNAERRAERQSRTDEIRQKYGLFKNGDNSNSYRRMEDEN